MSEMPQRICKFRSSYCPAFADLDLKHVCNEVVSPDISKPQSLNQLSQLTTQESSVLAVNNISKPMATHNIRSNQYASCVDPKTIRLEEFQFCKNKILELKLAMRLIQTSYLEEDKRLVFFFTAPERVDFRDLLRILRQQYLGLRIELRQIGQRDAASLLGGIGICGRKLCCCGFLRSFSPITAKIAKKVGPTPNPAMYCGLCGRLRCCLRYEETDEETDEESGDDAEWSQYEDP